MTDGVDNNAAVGIILFFAVVLFFTGICKIIVGERFAWFGMGDVISRSGFFLVIGTVLIVCSSLLFERK